jgi:hypothetical protein
MKFDQNFPKTYYMPPFQIHLLVIEKFQSLSNDQKFSIDKGNPVLVTIHTVTKNMWSLFVWGSKKIDRQ